jgi:hypothetical protein
MVLHTHPMTVQIQDRRRLLLLLRRRRRTLHWHSY